MASIKGTGGDDHLDGTGSPDLIYGFAGNDVITGGGGDDTLIGGKGDDYLWGDVGTDHLNGGAGNDILADSVGGDVIDGSAGIDTLSIDLIGTTSAPVAFAFRPQDGPVITPWGSTVTHVEQIDITGGDGGDTLTGGVRDDTVRGWNGDDILHGLAGNDYVIGDNGNDVLYGDAGNDTLSGGGNDDRLYGGAGNDTLIGGSTSDLYSGSDLLDGGAGADTFILAAFQHDTLSFLYSTQGVTVDLPNGVGHGGDAEGDVYQGNPYEYVIVQGSAHDDVLIGGAEQQGEAGNDRLVATAETALMTGGAGDDTFAFTFDPHALASSPEVVDFNPGLGEVIDLSAIDAKTGGADNAFTWLGTGAFDGLAGEARYEVQGGQTVIQLQTDKDAAVDYAIALDGVFSLQASEFVL